jgi:hypothetical protein
VTYLPDDPERHRVDGQTAAWVLPVMFISLGGLFGGVCAFIVLRVPAWNEGDAGRVRFDPERSQHSVWIGRA